MEKLIIRAITKNEKVKDKFTIYFDGGTYLVISPHEVSELKNRKLDDQMWLMRLLDSGKFLNFDETAINFFDLPPSVQAEVIKAVRKAEKG
jgi:hypothetical protein